MHLLSGSVRCYLHSWQIFPISVTPIWNHPHRPHSEEHFHGDYKSLQMDAKINHYITSALFSIYHTYEIILKQSLCYMAGKIYHFAPKINIIMTQSHGNTYWKLLSPFYNHKMTSLSLKSWHPETLKPQTINDTGVFLSLYFIVYYR